MEFEKKTDEIAEEMIAYFISLLKGEEWCRPKPDGIQFNAISEEESVSLETPFSAEEIKRAVDSLGADKAPGPNRFLISFFSHFWEVIKSDITDWFKDFHNRSRISISLGATFIALIPKMTGAASPKDFRPISLFGGPYKILAKVLAMRLSKVMGKLISDNQSAFITGRQIVDVALSADEVLDASVKSGRKHIICKLDIEKAYDHLDWDFLQYMLQRMGFGEKLRAWMRQCTESAYFSILLNSSPKGFFKSSRGLRQGDPLSPFLLLIAGEAL